MEIGYIHEPTDLQCGQAVLAMLTGKDTEAVCRKLNNERETTLKEMKTFLTEEGFEIDSCRREAFFVSDLPDMCVLSLETPRCWHWSLFAGGTFYDPEHGISRDFPECRRKYYWKINKTE